MADPQLTPEQMQRLVEQQKKFNEEALKTEGILSSLSAILQNNTQKLEKSTKKARDLNTSLGQGKNITAELNKEILESGKRIEELEFQRSKNLVTLSKKAALEANRRIDAELKVENLIRGQLELLDQHVKNEEKITAEKKKQASVSEFIGKKQKEIADSFQKITSYAFIFDLFKNAILGASDQATQLAKSLGVSKNEAYDIRQNFVEYSRASGDSFVNVNRLLKAQQALTEQLGIAVQFSGEETEQFARLTEIVGLSNEEAGKLAQFSAATGKNTKDYVADLRKGAFTAMQTNRIHISDKELLSSISKLSAGILVKFQNNPKAIAQAVVQAKALGTTLEQVDKTAESLLNFESSIEAELEAELITGKQLNFERARAAALTGDQVTLMEEMAAQAGSLAEYQNMNVIAQQSLAKAFGMSASEMADMLMKQEAINKYGDKAAELNAQQLKDMEEQGLSLDAYLKQQEEQRSIQEKFNDAIAKLQDLIGNLVAGPFGRLLDIVTGLLSHTEALAAISAIYITRLLTINALKLKESILSKKSAATDAAGAAANTAKSAASMGPLGWIAAGGAAIGIYALLTGLLDKGDDVISPGYGKRMIFSPEGAVALNNNDTIVAGTNLGGKGGDNSGVMAAISNLANTLSRPAPAPQFALNVDGQQLGSVVGKQQSTGTQQTINSYKLA